MAGADVGGNRGGEGVKLDGVEMTEAEREAWEERVAICVHDGLVSREQAEAIANEQVRKMRRLRCDLERAARSRRVAHYWVTK